MKFRVLTIGLLLLSLSAAAQSVNSLERNKGNRIGLSGKRGTEMLDPKMDANATFPTNYKNFNDDRLDELEKTMKEREWGNEEGAWNRACEIDTKQSYERYIAMYPNGFHVAEANCRLIEKKIEETLNNAHNDLPDIKRVEADDDSPVSIVQIRNNTGLPLTVYYSGAEIKSIVIPPDKEATITLENGNYKIAATVPPSHIRPYAGKKEFEGGRYEIGFWIVYM